MTPATATVPSGAKVQFSVSGTLTNGSTITPAVVYTASGGVVTPSGSYTTGTVTGAFTVIVVNYGEGVRVLPPICPHMEEPLEVSGVVANCKMTCTKHLWSWDLRSLCPQGETEKPSKTKENRPPFPPLIRLKFSGHPGTMTKRHNPAPRHG